MNTIKRLWSQPMAQWALRTLYYLAILIALLWLYGFRDTNTSTFIYNEF